MVNFRLSRNGVSVVDRPAASVPRYSNVYRNFWNELSRSMEPGILSPCFTLPRPCDYVIGLCGPRRLSPGWIYARNGRTRLSIYFYNFTQESSILIDIINIEIDNFSNSTKEIDEMERRSSRNKVEYRGKQE